MVERAEVGKINRLVLYSHIQRYLFASQFTSKKNVLDVACGVGYGSNILEEKSQPSQIVAGDIYFDGLKYGKDEYSKKINFCNLDAVNLPIRDSVFDVVVSFETIEHIKKPENFLGEILRVLKNDGIFICSTPNKLVTEKIGRTGKNEFHEKEFYHDELSGLLELFFNDIESYGQEEFGSSLFYKFPIMWKFWRLVRPILLQFLIKRKNLQLNVNSRFIVKKFSLESPTMIFVAKKY